MKRPTFLLAAVLLIASACSRSEAPASPNPPSAVCSDVDAVLDEVASIRQAAADEAGGLQEPVGTADPTQELARLAGLRDRLLEDSQGFLEQGDDQTAVQVRALADQIDMVVQRNTLEGVGSGDSGTDPTVNIESKAHAASTAAGCS